jgi:hypothetical protein
LDDTIPINPTLWLQSTTSTSYRYPSDGWSWQGYRVHQSAAGGSQMICLSQSSKRRLSSPGASRVSPGPPDTNPVWNTRNSPSSNLATEWGWPTTVGSTSQRQYGWLGFWRRKTSLLSEGNTVLNTLATEPCTGRRRRNLVDNSWELGMIGLSGQYWMDRVAIGWADFEAMGMRKFKGEENAGRGK